MAFCDFRYPAVEHQFRLWELDAYLFDDAVAADVRPEFAERIEEGADLAVACDTIAARSEFLIAPILLELRRSLRGQFTLFSGVEWTVDRELGLKGTCDFVLGRGPTQHILQAPFATVVQVKDLWLDAVAECIAMMVAAQISNERLGLPATFIHGVVTTGTKWRFYRLAGTLVVRDLARCSSADLPQLMGILQAIVTIS